MSDQNPEQENLIIEPTAFSRAKASAKKPLLTLNPVTVAVLVLFLVLATAALFMFNARAVRFSFTPATDAMEFTSGLPTYKLGERYLMLSGSYSAKAVHPGYYDLEFDFEVGEEPEQELFYELTKLPGILEVTTGNITGAEVFIDQVSVGVTPLTIDEVPAGPRDLYITHERYLPYQTEVLIEGMREHQVTTVELSPAWANIHVSSLPDGADVSIDDEVVGQTPAAIEVLQGSHEIMLKKPGYKTWQADVSLVAEEDQVVPEVVLIKSDGKLSVESNPAGVNVTISGQYYGQTPLAIALPPASGYKLLATKAGYEPFSRTFSIEPEEDQSFDLRLNPIVGLIRLSVAPSGANLFINGQSRGNPNQTLELTARRHQLRVELDGYATFETEITPQPGLAQQLNIVLQTEEEARVSSIPQRITTSLGNVLRFVVPETLSMGAGRREPGRRSNEIEKTVELTRPFYIGEKEIDNKTFKEFDPGHDSGLLGRALLSEDDRPVVNLSWEKAVRFCNWLSEKEGLEPAYEVVNGAWILRQPHTTGFRLPTEAEWAWAARYANGAPTRFPWGDAMPPVANAGNFADESAANMVPYHIIGYNDKFRGPAPSGTYPANELGLYDLAGNVSEWIHDYYSIQTYRETLTDPIGPSSGDYHVIRGSNYTHGRFSELRWTFRDYGSEPRPDVGFRIARYVE